MLTLCNGACPEELGHCFPEIPSLSTSRQIRLLECLNHPCQLAEAVIREEVYPNHFRPIKAHPRAGDRISGLWSKLVTETRIKNYQWRLGRNQVSLQ